MVRRLSRCQPDQRGIAAVEFALVVPFLVLLLMGIFDLGWAVYAHNTVALAAREGARVGIICTKTDADIRAQVKRVSNGLRLTDGQIVIVNPAGTPCRGGVRASGGPVKVTVNYTYHPVTPLIAGIIGGSGTLSVSSQASMVVE